MRIHHFDVGTRLPVIAPLSCNGKGCLSRRIAVLRCHCRDKLARAPLQRMRLWLKRSSYAISLMMMMHMMMTKSMISNLQF